MTNQQKYDYILRELRTLKRESKERGDYWEKRYTSLHDDNNWLYEKGKMEVYQAIEEYITGIMDTVREK